MPGLILRGSLRFIKQIAYTLFGFVLFWALLALMFFLGMAGLGAGGFSFGFGGLLRLVRAAVRFLSWIVLCCSRSLSSHCWEAFVNMTVKYISPLHAINLIPELMKFFHCYIQIMTKVTIATLHCWALIMYQRLWKVLNIWWSLTCTHFIETHYSPSRGAPLSRPGNKHTKGICRRSHRW